MAMIPRLRGCFMLLFVLVISAEASFPHDPGLSSLQIIRSGGSVRARMLLAQQDFEVAGLRHILPEAAAAAAIELEQAGVMLQPGSSSVKSVDADTVGLEIVYDNVGPAAVSFRATIMERLPRGHRQYVSIHDGSGRTHSTSVLSERGSSIVVPAAGEIPHQNATSIGLEFGVLGLRHIWAGFDHLIFLLGLLLAVGGIYEALKIITGFTVAHSVSLALAALDVVRLPSDLVEPLIALSIVYVGVENLCRGTLRGRGLVTMGFGLIHGLGFATALREALAGASHAGITLPLLSFNLGVELGQVMVAAAALPLLWVLQRRTDFQARWFRVLSAVVVAAGGFWLAERVIPGM